MLAASISGSVCCRCCCGVLVLLLCSKNKVTQGERMRSRRFVLMEEKSSLVQGLVQGRTQVAECSNLKLQQENREGGENSKALVGVGSVTSIAMRGELQGGSRGSEAGPCHVDYSEIPSSPPRQTPVHGPDRAAFGISKAAEVAVLAIDSVKSRQTPLPGDCVDDRNLLTQRKGKSTAEGRINDRFSKKLDPIGPASAPPGSHSSHEDEHGSQSQMPGTKDNSSRSAPSDLQCSRCKCTNFGIYSDGNAESGVIRRHYQCNNCKQLLCCPENVRFLKVDDRAEKGASQHTRRGNGQHGIIQAMSNLEPSPLAASNSNMKIMRPPSSSNMKAMPPPSSTQKPNICLPDSQDTAIHSAKTLPLRSSSCSDKLEVDHSSRESNLQLVVAPEQEERFPMKILEANGPLPLSANLKEPPSNQSAKENEKEPSFANDGFSVKGLRDNIRGLWSSPLEENKEGSGDGTVSDGGRPSNGLPCPSCKSTNTRFILTGRHYCDNCEKYWTLGHVQQHEVQLPSKQSAKGKEKEKESPYEDAEADQFSGKGLGDSSRGPCSLPLHGSKDGNGGSNEGPLNALRCSHCKSTFTRLCSYGVFCDACGKHTLYEGTRDGEVPANPPVAMVHEVFDADGRSRGYQLQSLPPPRRQMVDASTQTDPVAMVPLDSRFGKHIVHGLLHTHNHQVDGRKRRRGT